MDRGLTIENPYASVAVPHPQLTDGILKDYLGGGSAPAAVVSNPSSLPTYPATQERQGEAAWPPARGAWNGQPVPTQESWARPYNPYASLKMPGRGSLEPFHWKSRGDAVGGGRGRGCSPCCARCCPCCKRCCCVIS